jgi:O-succinylbenzoic acid--CoA ligase
VGVSGESVFRGYLGEKESASRARAGTFFQTEDLAYWDAQGGLNIVGRRDAVIITGGKKVFPSEVETLLRSSGVFADVAVVGVPDAKWGQCVVACFPAKSGVPIDTKRVESALRSIAAHKWPKRYVPVADWPRNMQGKLNRAALIDVAQAAGEIKN